MTVRILTPTPSCCPPAHLALHAGQHGTCSTGRAWITVDAIDVGRGNQDWFAKWVIV